MKRHIYTFGLVMISCFFLNCQQAEVIPNTDYNVKANELISQIISENECDCLLEFYDESLIEISKSDNPAFDIRKTLLEKLDVSKESELDSLENVSDNFKLDNEIVKRYNLKIITLKMLADTRHNKDAKLFKICQQGTLILQKPIFDKHYKTAAMNIGLAGTCGGRSVIIYKYKDGKWQDEWVTKLQ